MTDGITTVEFEDAYLATRVMNAIKMLGGMEVELNRDTERYIVYEND